MPINAARLVDELLDVHGYEVLINGVFNADPHPGNILYVANETNGNAPQLGLIDYGQVKYLSEKSRVNIAILIVLVDAAIKVDPRVDPSVRPEVHERAKACVAREMKRAGTKTAKMLDSTMYELGTVYYGRDDAAWIYPYNFLQWTDNIQAKDPMGSLEEVEDSVMVVQCGLMIRGLGHILQQPRNLAVAWGPHARCVLQEKGLLERTLAEIEKWKAP